MSTIATATRDAILDGTDRALHNFTLHTDAGAIFQIVSFDQAANLGFARGMNTGALVAFRVTARKPTPWNAETVRVAMHRLEDMGDAAGTLAVTERLVGGFVNRKAVGR